ncbi:SAICAR synthase-like protein [Phlegmacium glaucopus]|nr:SAICAR synthase-like protein [Phlegmacium glaucopus]
MTSQSFDDDNGLNIDNSTIQPFESQVGGHPGVFTTENESLVIKPALENELAFYQKLQQDSNLEDLRVFTPTFYGVLKLEGKLDETRSAASESMVVEPVAAEEKDDSTNLETNLSFPFLKPNILDIKLGTVLYDETAPPEKVARMKKVAENTTSLETGVRLTGFQVYDNITCQPVNTPKSYGKSIKSAQLGEGIAKFFPIGSPVSGTSDMPSSSSGLPKETLVPILRAICEEIAEIREVCAGLEMRMVGSSLLIVYEADWTRAEQSVTRFSEEEDEEDEDGDIEMDDDEDESSSKRPGPPFVVKLIDFAHTRFVPGEGPDKGVLLGMDTVLKLLDARLAELDAC